MHLSVPVPRQGIGLTEMSGIRAGNRGDLALGGQVAGVPVPVPVCRNDRKMVRRAVGCAVTQNKTGVPGLGPDKGSTSSDGSGRMTNETWGLVREELIKRVGRNNYVTWIEPLKFSDLRNGVARFEVPTSFFGDWVSRNFADHIRSQLNTAGAQVERVEFAVGQTHRGACGQCRGCARPPCGGTCPPPRRGWRGDAGRAAGCALHL